MVMFSNEKYNIEGSRIDGMVPISIIVESVFKEISTQYFKNNSGMHNQELYIKYLMEYYDGTTNKKNKSIPRDNNP